MEGIFESCALMNNMRVTYLWLHEKINMRPYGMAAAAADTTPKSTIIHCNFSFLSVYHFRYFLWVISFQVFLRFGRILIVDRYQESGIPIRGVTTAADVALLVEDIYHCKKHVELDDESLTETGKKPQGTNACNKGTTESSHSKCCFGLSETICFGEQMLAKYVVTKAAEEVARYIPVIDPAAVPAISFKHLVSDWGLTSLWQICSLTRREQQGSTISMIWSMNKAVGVHLLVLVRPTASLKQYYLHTTDTPRNGYAVMSQPRPLSWLRTGQSVSHSYLLNPKQSSRTSNFNGRR